MVSKNKKRSKCLNYNSFLFTTTARNVPRQTPPPATAVIFNKSYPVWQHGDKIFYAPLYSMPSNPNLSDPVAYIGKRRFKPRYSVEEINACKNITFKDYYFINNGYTIPLNGLNHIILWNHLPKLAQYRNNYEWYLALLRKIKNRFSNNGEYIHLYDATEMGSFCLRQEIYNKLLTCMFEDF